MNTLLPDKENRPVYKTRPSDEAAIGVPAGAFISIPVWWFFGSSVYEAPRAEIRGDFAGYGPDKETAQSFS